MKFQKHNGVIVPEQKASSIVIETIMQHDLLSSQLPKFLAMLDDERASLECVFRQTSGLGRYTVVYRHTKKFEVEIYC
jgi:hypothetical protein